MLAQPIPYDMGRVGDLLKHGVLAEFTQPQSKSPDLEIPLKTEAFFIKGVLPRPQQVTDKHSVTCQYNTTLPPLPNHFLSPPHLKGTFHAKG